MSPTTTVSHSSSALAGYPLTCSAAPSRLTTSHLRADVPWRLYYSSDYSSAKVGYQRSALPMATDYVGPAGNLDGLRFDSRTVVDVTSLDDAAALAERLVAPQGRRWQHVQSVASCATQLARAASAVDSDALIAAAWLHDIGYSPEVVHTRFHPLDGARFLREAGWPERVVTLVAHHSAARFEAAERGLSAELAKFLFEPSPTQDALDTADLTTGPNGERCSFGARMHEILYRYPADDPVHRSWLRAMPTEADAVRRTQARFAAYPSTFVGDR